MNILVKEQQLNRIKDGIKVLEAMLQEQKDNYKINPPKDLNKRFEYDFKIMALVKTIEALKKQIPKKPKYEPYKHLYICPNCGEFLQTYNKHQKYSMCCGQLLDWD